MTKNLSTKVSQVAITLFHSLERSSAVTGYWIWHYQPQQTKYNRENSEDPFISDPPEMDH